MPGENCLLNPIGCLLRPIQAWGIFGILMYAAIIIYIGWRLKGIISGEQDELGLSGVLGGGSLLGGGNKEYKL